MALKKREGNRCSHNNSRCSQSDGLRVKLQCESTGEACLAPTTRSSVPILRGWALWSGKKIRMAVFSLNAIHSPLFPYSRVCLLPWQQERCAFSLPSYIVSLAHSVESARSHGHEHACKGCSSATCRYEVISASSFFIVSSVFEQRLCSDPWIRG